MFIKSFPRPVYDMVVVRKIQVVFVSLEHSWIVQRNYRYSLKKENPNIMSMSFKLETLDPWLLTL